MQPVAPLKSAVGFMTFLEKSMNNFYREDFEGFAYLDFDNPTSAWNIARGYFITPSLLDEECKDSFLSISMAGLLSNSTPDRLKSELFIELVRAKKFPNCVSRLKGIFVFDEIESIAKFWEVNNWGQHFEDKYLSDVGVAAERSTRVDSNWIASIIDKNGCLKENCEDLIESYWKGEAFPNKLPIWERIVEGGITVWSNDIRIEAVKNILSITPDTWILLRYSSLCAKKGSNDGQIFPFLAQGTASQLKIEYLMRAKYMKDEKFLEELSELDKSCSSIEIQLPDHVNDEMRMPDLSGFSVNLDRSYFDEILEQVTRKL